MAFSYFASACFSFVGDAFFFRSAARFISVFTLTSCVLASDTAWFACTTACFACTTACLRTSAKYSLYALKTLFFTSASPYISSIRSL